MKKLLIILASTSVFGLLVLPAALGVLGERRHAEILAGLTGGPDAAHVVVETYQRGWLSSTVRYRVSFGRQRGEPVSRDRRLDLIIDSKIHHGPFPPSGEGDGLTPVLAQLRSTLALDTGENQWRVPGAIETRIGLARGGNLRYRAGPIEGVLPGGRPLNWEGADVLLKSDAHWHHLVTEGQIGRIRLEDADSNLLAGSIRLASALTRSPNGSWTGTIAMEIDEMAKTGSTAPGMRFEAVSINASVDDVNDNGYDLEARVSTESVQSGDWRGGSAVFDFRVMGLDRDALQVSLAGLRKHAVTTTSRAWTIDTKTAFVEFQPLLSSGVAVELKEISFPTRNGVVTAGMSFTLKPRDRRVAPSDILAALDANLSLQLPRIFIDRAAGQDGPNSDLLHNLLTYGLLESSGEYYNLVARYANGLLTVNGASLPLPSQPASM